MLTAASGGEVSQPMVPDLFVAVRTDGLGERLRALVKARILAAAYGREFRFQWTARPEGAPQQGVLSAEETFESQFIAEHGIEFDLGTCEAHPYGQITCTEVDGVTRSAVVVYGRGLPNSVLRQAAVAAGINRDTFRHFFFGLPFTPALRQALDLAEAVKLPMHCTALHLRGGDLVEGRHRFDVEGRFLRKVLPFPVAIKLVEQESAAGHPVLLFGQDAFLCRELVERYGATFAGDLPAAAGLTSAQAALFEIALMARCRRILAGGSAFAALAALIAETPVKQWHRVVPLEEEFSCVEDTSARPEWIAYPPLQRAFARWHAVHSNWESLPPLRRSEQLLEALADDPGNGVYQLLAAVSLAEAGLPAACEILLMHALAEDIESFRGPQRFSGIQRIVTKPASLSETRLRTCIDVLAKSTSTTYPYTAFVVALAYRQLDDMHDPALQHIAMFRDSVDQKQPDLRDVLLGFTNDDDVFQTLTGAARVLSS